MFADRYSERNEQRLEKEKAAAERLTKAALEAEDSRNGLVIVNVNAISKCKDSAVIEYFYQNRSLRNFERSGGPFSRNVRGNHCLVFCRSLYINAVEICVKFETNMYLV